MISQIQLVYQSDKMVFFYELNVAAEDQQDIITFCLNHLKSFIESEENDAKFVPL
jgi:hypothetical protein